MSTPADYRQNLIYWAHFLNSVRQFFISEQLLEVQTPTLVLSPGSEPYLDFFSTQKKLGSQEQILYLPPSPELSLKQLIPYVDQGLFEIRTCFRNNEASDWHRTEFFMLEWYRIGYQLSDLIQMTLRFLKATYQAMPNTIHFEWPAMIPQKTIAELFQEIYQFDLQPSTSTLELQILVKKHQLRELPEATFDDLFHYLMLEKIEPYLAQFPIVVVKSYPPSQAALAQLNSFGWAERFEIYSFGVELGNAYYELTDPAIQANRFQVDNQLRKSLGRPAVPLNPDFMAAYQGFPQMFSGIAFGLERWFMILQNKKQIHFWSPLFKF